MKQQHKKLATILSMIALVATTLSATFPASADTGALATSSVALDPTSTMMIIVLVLAIPTLPIGLILMYRFLSDENDSRQRARQLASINQAHTISTLGDISGAGQGQTAIVSDKGTQAVSMQPSPEPPK